MKKLFFAMLALALMGVACQKDFTAQYDGKDAVNVTIGVDIPDLEQSRSGETEMNSALGAIDNFSADEWSKYDVRYMLEVFDVTPGYENLTTPVKKRMVNILPEYAPTMFELRLIPGRTYKFVVWADFVADGTETDLNYNTADLRNITRTNGVQPMDESMDAYFIQEDVEVTEGLNKSLTLTRPFGKLRVVTTDIDEVNIGTIASKVDVTFYNHPTFTSLNAITGKAETEVSTVTYSYNIDKSAPYTKGYDAAANNQTIFADYIFAQPQDAGAQEINFTMAVTDQYGRDVRTHDFSTQIPLKRNHLTTIIGNLLTTYTEFEILIDDNFENAEDDEDWIVRVWDGKMGTIPAPNAEGVIEISNPADFAALLASDYKGLKVALTKDIDFGGYEIKHNPKMTTSGNPFVFDGQGHTVANFTVSDGANAGLFSVLVNATVKNLTIKDAVVAPNAQTRAYTGGDFYAGALAGTTMATCTIENVKVINCEVEGVNKVGGLIGNAAENWPLVVKNCSVEDSTIYTSSTEDGGCVGGFIGYIVPNATLEGNTVKNTTINAINSANEAKRANAEFVGAFHGNGKTLTMNENTLEGNTFTEAETSYVTPEDFGAWLGGIRLENGSDVIIDGKSVVYKPVVLATPVVEATVEGNVITLAWAAIENAATYTVTVGTEMPVVVEDTTYTFTGEYETEYTFNVVAVPADEKKFVVSEAATVTATTEAAPAAYTTVAEFLAADVDNTTFYTLKGTITRVANTSYGNFDLTDETGTIYVYGLYSEDGATNKYWAASGAQLGDDIVISAVRSEHNGSAQAGSARFLGLTSPGTLAFYTLNTNAVDFASAGGEQVIAITAYNTDTAVTATSDNSAFAVSVDGYNVTISAAANELEEEVTGNITIKVGDLAETVVKASLAAKPAAGVVEGGSSDFNTISNTNTSYVSGKTTAGWAYTNCAIFKGGTSDSSPAFKMIGDASNRALCMNGKTSAKGTITSPAITTGCGTLKFNYGLPFSDTKIKFTVDIIQNGEIVKTFTVDNSSATKLTKYSFEETIDVAGEFQIVFKNLSPSNSTSNKDRTAIWDVEWTGYNN